MTLSSTPNLKFTWLDVFTHTPYLGNPLAIVHIPTSVKLSQSQKQLIAREFNLSETVFLHEDTLPREASDPDALQLPEKAVTIDIFTITAEIPFAGHPTIGTGWYLLTQVLPARFPSSTIPAFTLRTKAGLIPVSLTPSPSLTGPRTVHLRTPNAFKIHPPYHHSDLKSTSRQPHLIDADYINGIQGKEEVVSVVKGMTFVLVRLASEDALRRLIPYSTKVTLPAGYLGEWAGLVGVYAFFLAEKTPEDDPTLTFVVRTRMFEGSLEDPATGSAASALSGWLCESRGLGKGTYKVRLIQGVEMGRRSEITVVVRLGEDGRVQDIDLEGGAMKVMEGSLSSVPADV